MPNYKEKNTLKISIEAPTLNEIDNIKEQIQNLLLSLNKEGTICLESKDIKPKGFYDEPIQIFFSFKPIKRIF